ncbi:MAG: hypothetical protein CMO81_05140 [Waddliaceae bacterium]|nr:hypothetical protein [Waddliaceae bacterium]|tara:strand:+ start:164 stop:352 length:189 start_codon:yes stop_codon:yes gene_type:complete
MKESELTRRIAYLESLNDQYVTELRYIDRLLRSIGFPEGLETVKLAAQDLKSREKDEKDRPY